MSEDLSLEEIKKEWHGTLKSYIVGFVSCLVLTLTSFFLVLANLIEAALLVYLLVFLALAQAVVQLRFFLHLGQEAKPRWESLTFYFMVLVLLIIALGTLWIMHDLDERTMSHMGQMHGG